MYPAPTDEPTIRDGEHYVLDVLNSFYFHTIPLYALYLAPQRPILAAMPASLSLSSFLSLACSFVHFFRFLILVKMCFLKCIKFICVAKFVGKSFLFCFACYVKIYDSHGT